MENYEFQLPHAVVWGLSLLLCPSATSRAASIPTV